MPGVASVTNLLGMQVQFFSLLAKLSLPWPNAFKNVLYFLELANLDPRDLFAEYDLPVIDFRVLFIFVANIFPLMIAVFFLIIFQPLYVVVWYTLTVTSFVAIGAGMWMNLMEGMDIGVWFAIGGGFILAICLICGLTFYCIYAMDATDDDVEADLQEERARMLSFQCKRSFLGFLAAGGFFFGGAVLTGMFFQLEFSNTENNSLRVLGFILYGLSGIAFLHFLIHLTYCGRRRMMRFREFLSSNLLMVMMVVLGISYVPAITYCLNNFMCTEYSCPAGSKFNPYANRTDDSYETSQATFCDPCVFQDQRCRLGGYDPQDPDLACPAFKGKRLWKAPEIECNDEAAIFFTISACLVLPAYLLLVPFLYGRLIRKVSTVIHEKARLVPQGDENIDFLPPLVAYDRKVYAVEPAASSLYQPYRMQHKYFAIPMLFFRIIVVAITAVVTPYLPADTIFILLSVHIVASGLLVWTSPFSSKIEYYLSAGCMGCNILNCVYAILLVYNVGLPEWFAYVVLGINFVLPLCLLIYTTKFISDSSAKTERGLKKEHKKHMKEKAARLAKARKAGDGAVPLMHFDDEMGDLDEDLHHVQRGRGASRAAAIDVPKGKEMSMYEKKQILEQNQALAQALNLKTSRLITKYFMIIGFVFVLALGASTLGYVRHNNSPFIDGSSRLQRSYEKVLGGYKSWTNFTEGCCCIASRFPPLEYTLQERWVCPNMTKTVGRGRVGVLGENSGLPIRGFCSNVFNFSVSVVLNGTDTNIIYHNDTQLEENHVTETAADLYW